MADVRFTPGPWKRKDNPDGYADIVTATEHIAMVAKEGNANLIAAAPELYDALKAILGFFDSGDFGRDVSRDFEPGWHMRMIPVVKSLTDAKAALVKAGFVE